NILRPNDALILMNVQPKTPLFPHPSAIDVSELVLTLNERLRVDSHMLLIEAVGKARKLAPDVKIQAISLKGDPREVLLEEIEILDANCVVMGSRGLGKLKGTVMGSVSTYLLHHVRCCPVICVKPE
ncbi:hypothetical protein HDU99_003194, partial [Rhizoclosmatium hyalinum]